MEAMLCTFTCTCTGTHTCSLSATSHIRMSEVECRISDIGFRAKGCASHTQPHTRARTATAVHAQSSSSAHSYTRPRVHPYRKIAFHHEAPRHWEEAKSAQGSILAPSSQPIGPNTRAPSRELMHWHSLQLFRTHSQPHLPPPTGLRARVLASYPMVYPI